MLQRLCGRCKVKNTPSPKSYRCTDCSREGNRIYRNSPEGKAAILRKRRKAQERCRAFLFNYLRNNPCMDCGEPDPVVLEFDHVRGIKKKGVTELIGAGLTTLQTEIEKCDVVCANCHTRRHFHLDSNGYRIRTTRTPEVIYTKSPKEGSK